MFIKLISVNSPRGINNDEKEGDIFMCQTVLNHFRGYEGLSQTEQIDKLADELEAAGIEPVIVERRNSNNGDMAYFVGEEYVTAIIPYPDKKDLGCVLLDCNIYNKYLKDRKGSLSLVIRRDKGYKIRLQSAGYIIADLHRLVVSEAGHNLTSSVLVDHIFMNPLVNTLEALRPCTHSENKRHSKVHLSKALDEIARSREPYEFIYDPSVDFTNTGYAYVLHKMLGIGTWEDLRDYNIDYIKRNNASLTNLYSGLSAMVKADIDPKFANESWYRAITAF